MTQKNHVFTSISGREIPIMPISPAKLMRAEIGIEKAFRKKGLPIDPPTYTVEVAGGGIEEHVLDDSSIESGDPEETKRRQEAWDAHVEAITEMHAEQLRVTKKIVLESIDIPLPEDDSWIKEQEELYIEVPEDPYERWIHWLETEVLLAQDINEIVLEIMVLSGTGLVSEEDIETMRRLFRGRASSESEQPEDESNPAGGDAQEERTLDSQQDNA